MSIRNKLLQDILSAIGGGGSVLWGSIGGTIGDQTDLATVASTNDYDDLINKFDPTADIAIERILDAASSTAAQEPTGTGVANQKLIDFGPAVNTGVDPAQTDINGLVTFNETGLYRLKLSLQFGRTGASGTSFLLFKVDVNDVQAGRSILAKLANSNEEQYFENDTWISFPAGTVLKFYVMRDDAGNDSGGLFGFSPTVDSGNEWNDAPSASLRIERLIPTP